MPPHRKNSYMFNWRVYGEFDDQFRYIEYNIMLKLNNQTSNQNIVASLFFILNN